MTTFCATRDTGRLPSTIDGFSISTFRKTLLNKVLATALLAACCTLAHAQISPAKKDLVAKVLQLQRPVVESQARAMAERPALMMMQQIAAVVQQRVPLEKREAVLQEVQVDVRKYVDEVVPLMRERALRLLPTTSGAVLETKFSEAELKQLVATLESPVFVKYQQSTEEMFRPLSEKLVPEMRADLEPKLKALNQVVNKRLEAAIGQPAASGAPIKP